MQLICSTGTFLVSSVADNPGALIIRAPVKLDLVRLRRELLPDLAIQQCPDAEQRGFAIVARDEWAMALELLAERIA